MPALQEQVSFADVFSGCGGLSLGFLQAGCRGVFAIEKDKFAFDTFKSNLIENSSTCSFDWPDWLPKKPVTIDTFLQKYKAELEKLSGSIDLLVGGPPCQGFSTAGKRKGDDPRNKLFRSYLKLVGILKPRAVLIENVRGFTVDFDNGKRTLNYAAKLQELLSQNYEVHEELLNVAEFGVPQRRIRYFLIALEKGLCDGNPFDQLRQRLPSYLRSLGLQAPISSWAAISDLEIAKQGVQPSAETPRFHEIVYGHPISHYQCLMNAGCDHPSDLRLARHAPEIARRFNQIIQRSHAEGRLNTSIGSELRERFGLKKRALRVLDPDKPSPTVTSMPDDLLHYAESRTLTVRENARLQSFPDWFAFKGKYTTGGHLRRLEVPRFTQVANAVPPLVARAFGELLTEILKGRYSPPAILHCKNRVKQTPKFMAQV